MSHKFSECVLVGVALLAVGCSGRSIFLTTGTGEADNGGTGAAWNFHDSEPIDGANTGVDSKGGSNFGSSAGGGSGAHAGPVEMPYMGPPELSGWVAFDTNADFNGTRHIWLLSLDGTCNRNLSNEHGQQKQPAFSPDAKQVAYAADSSGIFQIYLLDLETLQHERVTNEAEGASYPSWSPDGKSIAFVTGDPEDHPDVTNTVMLMDTTTFKTRALISASATPQRYRWSTFARNDLLLVGNDETIVGIHTDALTSYDVVPLSTPRIPRPAGPSIQPNGEQYVFSDYCGGQSQLFLARVDGTTGDTCDSATPLAANRGSYLMAASWGPRGYIAAETDERTLVLVPSDGSVGIQALTAAGPGETRNPAFAPTTSLSVDCGR